MTYTIIGCCERTRQLGLGIATFSLAVGSYCPLIEPGLAALSSQAYVNAQLGVLAMGLLGLGYSPAKTLAELSGDDPHIEYRQVGIVDHVGTAVAHSGSEVRRWAGHITGRGYVAMGNALAGPEVTAAMAASYQEAPERDLDERLLRALEAGRDAGGQRGDADERLDERSAVVSVYARDSYPELDLRVDAHEAAVDELRRIHGLYKPYLPYYRLRAKAPQEMPAQEVWARENLGT